MRTFTLIETLILVIIIGILSYSIDFKFFNPSLRIAADQIVSDIKLTQSLALKDDKYQPFPKNSNFTEMNRSKYWFKQFWQIRFSTFKKDGVTHYWYEIFSDQPYNKRTKNFTAQANLPTNIWEKSIAKNPLTHKYMIGHCGVSKYPDCDKVDNKLDLTKTYGIKKIKFINFGKRTKRLMFDNFGNIFLKEGKDGDAGDINPLDRQKRPLLTKIAIIKICKDTSCKIYCNIKIHPSGLVYVDKCSD